MTGLPLPPVREDLPTRAVAVLMFDDVEVLDFAGPFEVFGVTGKRQDSTPFEVFTVAERRKPVCARNGLEIVPRYVFEDCPALDILVVPGGFGTRREMNNEPVISWVRDVATRAEIILSVCTGALILGRAGLLDGLEVTTHHGALDLLHTVAPTAIVSADRRFVDNGRIVTAAGISAGIDASLHVVGRLLGPKHAAETARYMEYELRS